MSTVATTAPRTTPSTATAKSTHAMTNNMKSRSSSSSPVTLTPYENLAVGAVGGALEVSLQMPILTYKFCVQEGRALPKSIGGWYRGVFVQAGTVAPITALQFMVNGMIQNSILQYKKSKETSNATATAATKLSSMEQIYAAAGAGFVSAVVYSPVDLITIQQQKLVMNPIQTGVHIVRNFGIMNGICRGFWTCAGRETIYTAGYLGLAPVLTSEFVLPLLQPTKDGEASQSPTLLTSFVGACIAGTVAAVITHPLDTAKTCVQSDMVGKTWSTGRQAIRELVANHGGISSLYRGMIPRTTRLCGAFFVCLCVRDAFVSYKEKQQREQ